MQALHLPYAAVSAAVVIAVWHALIAFSIAYGTLTEGNRAACAFCVGNGERDASGLRSKGKKREEKGRKGKKREEKGRKGKKREGSAETTEQVLIKQQGNEDFQPVWSAG
ncbi:MAG: hypothetical protein CMI13_06760 [Oleibacter sp.]|nr:hypothetical protein [Thalassolituus sp.]